MLTWIKNNGLMLGIGAIGGLLVARVALQKGWGAGFFSSILGLNIAPKA